MPCISPQTSRIGIGGVPSSAQTPGCVPVLHREALDFAFDFVQRSYALYCLRTHRAQVVLDQFIKLAACVGNTTRADAVVDDNYRGRRVASLRNVTR
jgi:hypothetical protein